MMRYDEARPGKASSLNNFWPAQEFHKDQILTLWKLWQDASQKASANARLLPGEISLISYHLRKITHGSQRFATPVYLDPFGSAVGRRLCILPGISRHVRPFHT